jgi:hypothetical protein
LLLETIAQELLVSAAAVNDGEDIDVASAKIVKHEVIGKPSHLPRPHASQTPGQVLGTAPAGHVAQGRNGVLDSVEESEGLLTAVGGDVGRDFENVVLNGDVPSDGAFYGL